MPQPSARRLLNPKKLTLSKWTAVVALQKEKHFIVTRTLEPASPELPIETVEMQAVFSRRSFTLPWRELLDTHQWHQGWK